MWQRKATADRLRQSAVFCPMLLGSISAIVRDVFAAVELGPLGNLWMVLVFPGCLIALAYPFYSAKRAALISFSGCVGLFVASPFSWRLFFKYWSPFPLTWLPLGLVASWLVFVPMMLAIVTVRCKYWPRYGPGRCQHCGYMLFGLASKRCPECGTPFEEIKNETQTTQIHCSRPRE